MNFFIILPMIVSALLSAAAVFAAAPKDSDDGKKSVRQIIFGLPSLGMTSFAVQLAADKNVSRSVVWP
jgi:hypothetical protein